MIGLVAAALAGQRRIMLAGIACAVLAALSAVGLLAVSGLFLAGATIAGASGIAAVQAFNYLLPSAAIRAAAIIRTGTRYGERMFGHRAALFALAQVRTGLFRRVAAGALAGNIPGRPGELATRLGKDVDALEDSVIRRISRPGAWASGTAGLVGALAMGWRASAVYLVALAAMRVTARGMAIHRLPPLQARLAAAYAALQADYADMAGPSADIMVYGLAPALTRALDRPAQAHDEARMALARAEAAIQAVQTIVATTAIAAMTLTGRGPAPAFAFGLLAAMAAFEGWGGLAASDLRAQEVEQAARRLAALDGDTTRGKVHPLMHDAPVLGLCGVECTPGSRVLIAGASGAGKTRLVETLLGLRHDAPQDLRINGQPPETWGLVGLRGAFALCAQDAAMIAGSVADNLGLARPGVTPAEMWDALTVACAADMVRALPDGLNQWLGGDGARLSGGQRRRLALARAVLAERPWLVLDEPSEGLDTATESDLIGRLDAWLRETGTGLLLISHRPAMAMLADQVVPI
ncbi:amino acid ABC transporter ATP-binding/permease protein [Novosphingobium sp. Fuku2-ISO-50]|uniref:amino acid ABC transporter ATP-binding/permease protein n=1 Tax=Novosphingobium sp. Fuku2-ISO-50 TaxID=1739114 RepID=UPI00076D1092|nr:ATP-binding cassette domain-containing protein [Novosphingobium sp. Fuku2-ISO-50]KUR76739.1 ABC transporter [Novosphingobium sp. Fuku2-ISO-50]